jgi:hypothetical protein
VPQPEAPQRVAQRRAEMAGEREVARAERVEVVHHVAQPAQREPDAGAARLPECQRQVVQERPERPVGLAVPEGTQPLAMPCLGVAVQCHHPVGEPGDVAGKRLTLHGRQADRGEQLGADATRSEVHQRRRADVE